MNKTNKESREEVFNRILASSSNAAPKSSSPRGANYETRDDIFNRVMGGSSYEEKMKQRRQTAKVPSTVSSIKSTQTKPSAPAPIMSGLEKIDRAYAAKHPDTSGMPLKKTEDEGPAFGFKQVKEQTEKIGVPSQMSDEQLERAVSGVINTDYVTPAQVELAKFDEKTATGAHGNNINPNDNLSVYEIAEERKKLASKVDEAKEKQEEIEQSEAYLKKLYEKRTSDKIKGMTDEELDAEIEANGAINPFEYVFGSSGGERYISDTKTMTPKAEKYQREVIDVYEGLPDDVKNRIADISPFYDPLTKQAVISGKGESSISSHREHQKQVASSFADVKNELYSLGYNDDNIHELLLYSRILSNAESANKISEDLKKATTGELIAANLESIPANLTSGLGQADITAQTWRNRYTKNYRPVDYYTPLTERGRYAREVRKETNDRIENPVMNFLYNTGMSMADSTTAMLFAQQAAPFLLSGSAGLNAIYDAKERGASDIEAVNFGITSAISEALFEAIPVNRLFGGGMDVKGWRSGLVNALKQAFTEGSEEVGTSIFNSIADAIIMGDKSEFNTNVQKYITEGGYSRDEAERLAWTDYFKSLGLDFAGGLLSGFVFGGADSISRGLKYKKDNTSKQDLPNRKGENLDDSNIILEKDETNYPYDEREVIDGYEDAINNDLLNQIEKVKTGDYKDNDTVYFPNVSERAAEEIGNLLGIDVSGFKSAIEARQIKHILKRHGEKGIADTSMRNDSDLARVGYVLNNFDNIGYAGTTEAYTTVKPNGRSKTADTIEYSKKINGTYYVVQAVPDTKRKTLYVVSAYIGNKKTGTEQLADVSSPDATSDNGFAHIPVDNSISHPADDVKRGAPGSAERAVWEYEKGERATVENRMYDSLGEAGQAVLAEINVPSSMLEDFIAYYDAGLAGSTVREVNKRLESRLPASFKNAAHFAGLTDRATKSEQNSRIIRFSKNPGFEETEFSKGNKILTKEVRKQLAVIGEALGFTVRIGPPTGKYGRNAVYSNGIITIAADADTPMLALVAHETVHHLRLVDEAAYNELSRYVGSKMIKAGTFESKVREIYDEYYESGEQLDRDSAIEELNAYFIEDMAKSQNIFNELVNHSESLATKIFNHIKKLLTNLKHALSFSRNDYGLTLREGDIAIKKWQTALEKMQAADKTYSDSGSILEGKEKISIARTRNMTWKKQIDGYFKKDGTIKSSDSLYIGESESFLKKYGIKESPLYLPTGVITKAMRSPVGSKSGHDLSQLQIKNIKAGIYDAPIIVLNPDRNSLIYITNLKDSEGRCIIVPFELNTNLHGENAHKALSIYGRSSILTLFQSLPSNAKILCKNENKLNDMLAGNRKQLSELLATIELIDDIISQEGDKVNTAAKSSVKRSASSEKRKTTSRQKLERVAERRVKNKTIRSITDLGIQTLSEETGIDEEELRRLRGLYTKAHTHHINKSDEAKESFDRWIEETMKLSVERAQRVIKTSSLIYTEELAAYVDAISAHVINSISRPYINGSRYFANPSVVSFETQTEIKLTKDKLDSIEVSEEDSEVIENAKETIDELARLAEKAQREGEKARARSITATTKLIAQKKRLENQNERLKEEARGRSKLNEDILRIAKRLIDGKHISESTRKSAKELFEHYDLESAKLGDLQKAKLGDLRIMYDALCGADPSYKDSYIEQKIKSLEQLHVSDLNDTEALALLDVLKDLEHKEREFRKVAASEKALENIRLAKIERIILSAAPGLDMTNGFSKLPANFATEFLTPENQILRIVGWNKSSTLYTLYKRMDEAYTEMLKFKLEMERKFSPYINDKDFMKHLLHDKIDIGGVTVSPNQLISLILHSRGVDNMRHISIKGIVIPSYSDMIKGKDEAAWQHSKIAKFESKAEIQHYFSKLTERQKKLLEAIDYYFNVTSRNSINKTSVKITGGEIARKKNYFPISVDKDYLSQSFISFDANGMPTFESPHFRERIVDANKPILLYGATDVLASSINWTAKYAYLAEPMQNFKDFYNMTIIDYDVDAAMTALSKAKAAGEKHYAETVKQIWQIAKNRNQKEPFSLKHTIEQKWGENANKQIQQIFKDLAEKQSDDSFYMKLRGRAARAILTVNPSSALVQLSGLAPASSVLDIESIMRAYTSRARVDDELIFKYSPLLEWRKRGYLSQEIGSASRNAYEQTLDSKVDDIFSSKFLDWLTAMDLWTARKIWQASEIYVNRNFPDLKSESGVDAYYKKVSEKFNEAIKKTQPNNTPLQRPRIMRKTSVFWDFLTLFKSQTYACFNELYAASAELHARAAEENYTKKRRTKEENQRIKDLLRPYRKKVKDAYIGFVLMNILTVLLRFAAKFLQHSASSYENDEGDLTAWSTLKGILFDLSNNTFEVIPVVGTIVNALVSSLRYGSFTLGETFSAQSAEMLNNVITGAYKLTENILNDEKSGEGKQFIDLSMDVATYFGIPAENVVKDIAAPVKWIADVSVGMGRAGDFMSLWIDGNVFTTDKNGQKVLTNDALIIAARAKMEDKNGDYAIIKDFVERSGVDPEENDERVDRKIKRLEAESSK